MPPPSKRAKLSGSNKDSARGKLHSRKSQKERTNQSTPSQRRNAAPSLRELAENDDTPFVIKQGHRVSKSPKSPAGFRLEHHPYFDDDVGYAIQLNGSTKQGFAEWDNLSHHRKALVPEPGSGDAFVPFKVGDVIYVRNDGTQAQPNPSIKDWVALILEISALRDEESQKVWVRVWWFFRPEDLPQGRQPHHGAGEIFPSTCMEIIDIETVDYHVEGSLLHLLEDQLPLKTGSNLFWRQTYDFVTQQLEPGLQKHCRCRKHVNPSLQLLRCPDSSCNALMHEQCLIEDAIENAYRKASSSKKALGGSLDDTELAQSSTETNSAPPAESARSNGLVNRLKLYLNNSRASSVMSSQADAQNSEPDSDKVDVGTSSNVPSSTGKRARKSVKTVNFRDAAAHFDAWLEKTDSAPPKMRIKRLGGEAMDNAWFEDVKCLVCGANVA